LYEAFNIAYCIKILILVLAVSYQVFVVVCVVVLTGSFAVFLCKRSRSVVQAAGGSLAKRSPKWLCDVALVSSALTRAC
jgi:hypothetical protein